MVLKVKKQSPVELKAQRFFSSKAVGLRVYIVFRSHYLFRSVLRTSVEIDVRLALPGVAWIRSMPADRITLHLILLTPEQKAQSNE